MTAQEYIESKLEQLKQLPDLPRPKNQDELVDTIYRLLTSKKFRKYSITPEYALHTKNAIKENIQKQQPINLTFLGGSYKLWRLEESPECDWAELFAYIYFSRWVQSTCAIYEPGVWFDFMLDDVIVARLNNIPESDVSTYRESRDKLIEFIRPFQPQNMNMTITGVGSLFPSRSVYEEILESEYKKLSEELPGGIPQLSEAQLASTELNVRATPEQKSDPKWREKVELLHMAYMKAKASTGYSQASSKIRVFTQPFPNGTSLSVGSTKDSVAKFWVSVGALKPRDGSYRQIILSPKQLEAAKFDWQDVNIPGLEGKNFSRVRVLAP